MSAASDYLETAICNWLRGTAMPSAPAKLYVGLFNGNPTDTGTGVAEVTTNVRAAGRVEAPFGAPSDGLIVSSAVIDFGKAAATTEISHYGVFDAVNAGNMLFHGAIDGGAKTLGKDTQLTMPAGQLTFRQQ